MSTTSARPGIPKCPTGIHGFDLITAGGLPRNGTTLIVGGPGSGKSVFALQTLYNAARTFGESGLFVACEEIAGRIETNIASFNWAQPPLGPGRVVIVDAMVPPDVVSSGAFDLVGLLAMVEAGAADIGARRVVFDSLDVLLSHLDDPRLERREIQRVSDWLARRELSAVITAKADVGGEVFPKHFSYLPFSADCVVELDHRVADWTSTRTVQVVKYRGSTFARNAFPFLITADGIDISSAVLPDLDYAVSTEHVSTGVPRLDAMLGGGVFRGSSVLITGAPGTAKSTLAGSCANAACVRGESSLYVSFDETAGQIVRNMESIGLNLGVHVRSGQLVIHASRSGAAGPEENFAHLRALIDDQSPRFLIIDPITALMTSGDKYHAAAAVARILDLAKSRGITVVCTSLIADSDPHVESTATLVSTIADTWIQLSYAVLGGERNRALTIVKSRGTRHSNQVRELVLGEDGITLSDVFTAGGQVLMGTARWEHEFEVAAEKSRRALETEHRRLQAEAAKAEIAAKIATLQSELAVHQTELEGINVDRQAIERREIDRRRALRDLRHGDNRGAPPIPNEPEGVLPACLSIQHSDSLQ